MLNAPSPVCWIPLSHHNSIQNGDYRHGPHNDISNVLFADGHCKSLKNRALTELAYAKRVWP